MGWRAIEEEGDIQSVFQQRDGETCLPVRYW